MGYSGGLFPMQPGPGPVPGAGPVPVPGPAPGPTPAQNPQWSSYGQQATQGGPNFYPQQVPPTPVPGPGTRFDRPGNTSKQALSHMLRMRLPTNQYMGQTGQQPNMNPNFQPMPRQQFIR